VPTNNDCEKITNRSPKRDLLGVGVSAICYGELLQACRQWIGQKRYRSDAGQAHCVCFLSVHSIMTAYRDHSIRSLLNRVDIAATDGMPLVWALRSFGVKSQQRVYGPDAMLAVCAQAAELGHRIFLYGGTQESLLSLERALHARFPNLNIVGAIAPPFRRLTEKEDECYIQQILTSGAEIVFVGIGMPKQEQWMINHKSRLPGIVILAVGAAFDFHARRTKQAPLWMQKAGLEWFFRLIVEPRRLWRRYLLINPPFLLLWMLQLTKLLRYPVSE
jgi:N-acetylglucosaminyldiphosphoundecaprenol N-acetyl-beta-D-mannosaminyltransferase